MKTFIACLCWFVAVHAIALDTGEEFNGPFSSWRNVKTFYGATGDGVSDDTAAIQIALDDLKLHTNHCVLYFPAGTYNVSSMLTTVRVDTSSDFTGISLIGENPTNTVLRWTGASNSIFCKFDMWYYTVRRLTFDGGAVVGGGVLATNALEFTGHFSTYNEISDCTFQNVKVGLRFGRNDVASNGQAETTVLRCHFTNCTERALLTDEANVLNIWVWYSSFIRCNYGIYNLRGNFGAYSCLFTSNNVDITSSSLNQFSIWNCVSFGPNYFIYNFDPDMGNSDPSTIAENRVIGATNQAAGAIYLSGRGHYTIVGNSIQAETGNTNSGIWIRDYFYGRGVTTALSNKFSMAANGFFWGSADHTEIDTTHGAVISGATLDLPIRPPNVSRSIWEVSTNTALAAVQAVINSAAADGTTNPIVHFPKGSWNLAGTLTIPSNRVMSIVGDGTGNGATLITYSGAARYPLFRFLGPTLASIRDLKINSSTGFGVQVEASDQSAATVYMSQPNVAGGSPGAMAQDGILIDGLTNAMVHIQGGQSAGYNTNWIRVVGRGVVNTNTIAVWGGGTGTSVGQYSLYSNATLVVRALYHEQSTSERNAFVLTNAQNLYLDNCRFSYDMSTAVNPIMLFSNFTGNALLSGCYVVPVVSTNTSKILRTGTGAGSSVMVVGCDWRSQNPALATSTAWYDDTAPAGAVSSFRYNTISTSLPDYGTNWFRMYDTNTWSSAGFTALYYPVLKHSSWTPSVAVSNRTCFRLQRVQVEAGAGGRGIVLMDGVQAGEAIPDILGPQDIRKGTWTRGSLGL